jgi:tRNA (cytidine/uridine-2'-O-)-methyltransferase
VYAQHVALIAPEIPWNAGNAGRSCLAFGARLHLVGPLGFSLDERAVRRAGLDYWRQVEPASWPDLETFEAALPTLGRPIVLTAEAPRPLWRAFDDDDGGPVVFVLGRESVGLPPDFRARYRELSYAVPMDGTHVRALNLSTTVGVALYERARAMALHARPPV